MEHVQPRPVATALVALPAPATPVAGSTARVLRNTYALLAMTLLFSAATAAASAAWQWPAPGVLLTLAGYVGLLFAIHTLRHSGWAVGAVFALTGFMGHSLGPVLAKVMTLPGGGQTIALALGATGGIFLALSAWVLRTRRDFSAIGGFLFAGMIVAVITGLAAIFLEIPALGLAVSAIVALLSAGLILFETSRIVHGGETNYVLATVGLYASLLNLFMSLLTLAGIGGGDE
jgi:modulator of FtsH protease